MRGFETNLYRVTEFPGQPSPSLRSGGTHHEEPLAVIPARVGLARCLSPDLCPAPPGTYEASTSFSFESPPVVGMIDAETKVIRGRLLDGTDLSSLAAVFAASCVSVPVHGVEQASGVTVNPQISRVAMGYRATKQLFLNQCQLLRLQARLSSCQSCTVQRARVSIAPGNPPLTDTLMTNP